MLLLAQLSHCSHAGSVCWGEAMLTMVSFLILGGAKVKHFLFSFWDFE